MAISKKSKPSSFVRVGVLAAVCGVLSMLTSACQGSSSNGHSGNADAGEGGLLDGPGPDSTPPPNHHTDGGIPDASGDVGVREAVATYTVSGTVSGLAGIGLVLNNGSATTSVSANGAFSFTTPLPGGAGYTVTVATQPSSPTQICTVGSGTGIIAAANVTNVTVTCKTSSFAVGGNVTGLLGSGLVLEDNSGDDLALGASGSFTFATMVASANAFSVTVKTQPSSPTQACVVTGGSGIVGSGNIASIVVNCQTGTFTVGGAISGLGGTIVLQNNGGGALALNANGTFAFATPVASGAAYAITVLTQPTSPSQSCVVTSGTGTVAGAAATSVRVVCVTNAFAVGVTVTGLAGQGLVLQDNGGDNLSPGSDGNYTFPTHVPSGSGYSVSVLGQPSSPSQTCGVIGGSADAGVTSSSGNVGNTGVTGILIGCTTNIYSVGGSVSGLAGMGLVLEDNAGDDLGISASGAFSFVTPIGSGSMYTVTVLAQPSLPTQTCNVSGGMGTLVSNDVTSVTVNCLVNSYAIGGTISGLAGTAILQNNLGETVTASANGTFAFATPALSGSTYAVTVLTQPGTPSQTCTVANGSGPVGGADVTSVNVSCVTRSYAIGGMVTGLTGSGLKLQDNGGDDLPVGADGSFAFATPVLSGTTFGVTVLAGPNLPTQTCTVTGGAGSVGVADVSSVTVTCVINSYAIGGTVIGLAGSSLVLQDNSGDNLSIAGNGAFAFGTPVASGQAYSVSVLQQASSPTQTCVVTAGGATVGSGDVASVVVTCTTNLYTVGATVVGLLGSGLVLQDNGGDDDMISVDGSFTFATSVASSAPYAVTILTQPSSPSQTCTLGGAMGDVVAADVASVTVNCSTNLYTIGGTISGLAGTVVLQDNFGDDLMLSTNGSFSFATPIASGALYAASVFTQPGAPSQTCMVATGTGTGTLASLDVTSIVVTCQTNRFNVGGTISGLAASDSLVLQNNAADDLTVNANGTFTFVTSIDSGGAYAVTVLTQPTSPVAQSCVVTSAGGLVGASDITDVVVTCVTPMACTKAITSILNETNPFAVPLSVTYSMVGGGGGVGGGVDYWEGGGGGGSSAILGGGALVSYASGGSGGSGGDPLNAGANGTTASGSFSLAIGANITAYVGGGGGGGGWDFGAGGGAGYFGGAGGSGAGGTGGSNSGGVGGGISGSSLSGGAGGSFARYGQGGTSGTGGAGGSIWDGGGGGGGFGGGGGACDNSGAVVASNGGSNGASASSAGPDPGGIGANTWSSSTSLPAAAGLGAATSSGQGGNAGLVILTYSSPTGVCSL
jgi:hypothetical protein